MKGIYILISFLLIGITTNAQTAPAVKTAIVPRVVLTVTPNSFESNMAPGNVNLLKIFTRTSDGADYKLTFSLTGSDKSNAFNNGKPLEMKLTRDFFDGPFLRASREIADRSSILLTFIQEKNIALTDEKGWIALITYYNNLQ